jgi:hypothetical protein
MAREAAIWLAVILTGEKHRIQRVPCLTMLSFGVFKGSPFLSDLRMFPDELKSTASSAACDIESKRNFQLE